MGSGHHHHDHQHARSGTRLFLALILNVGITVAQVIGGLISGSLSLIADALHNGSDAAALAVSYASRRIARRRADRVRTFGYERAEVVGALINLTTLIVVAVFLLFQAVMRLFEPPEVLGSTMLIVGAIAFIEDAISAWLLFGESRESMNVRSAFIHMVGDTLATLGVLVGGFLILRYEIYWIDPAITAAIGIYIAVHGGHEIRGAIRILMESAPRDFDFDGMIEAVEKTPGVENIHHVHLWRLDERRVALEAHIAIDETDLHAIEEIKRSIKQMLHDRFEIEHTTLEIEIAGHTDHGAAAIVHE